MANRFHIGRWLTLGIGCFALALSGCNGSESFPITYTLTVNTVSPASGVMIGVAPADVSGNAAGSSSFTRLYTGGVAVTLTAPAMSGALAFASWNGCTTTSGLICMVAMNTNNTVTATYAIVPPITYNLIVNSVNPVGGLGVGVAPVDNNGAGAGTTSFKRNYNAGTAVVLTASANTGNFAFVSWTGCTSTMGVTCNVKITADTSVTANYVLPPQPTFVLTVNSTYPSTGVGIGVSVTDLNGGANGNTNFTRLYNSGQTVMLTAPAVANGDLFANWTGCTTTTGASCNVAMTANTTVSANYTPNAATAIVISPSPATAILGSTQPFAAVLTGTGVFSQGVTWTVAGPTGYTGSAGNITSAGVYTTPYPAPASVTVTATSITTPTLSASVTVALSSPATAAGPALSVDGGASTRSISPLIYGVNAYVLDAATIAMANPSILRWGGDDVERYNYLANTSNEVANYYFENSKGASNVWPTGNFADLVTQASTVHAQVVGDAPVLGWVSNSDTSSTACSFSKTFDPNQKSYNGVCGNGIDANGSTVYGNNAIAAITSISVPPPPLPPAGQPVASSWVGNWVTSIVSQFGPGNPMSGTPKGVAHWDLSNEPEYWSAQHRDVHPVDMTYDEITNGGIGTALAIKTSDPTALVSGPVISNWYNYFYSTKDVNGGYGTGPCYKAWSKPVDRTGHGGVPLVEYYLQQMQAAQTTYGMRLLDYVDLHTYFAANYNGVSTGLTTAGDTAEQIIRMNSTRVFWDPTYTDPNYTVPNYVTDAGYSATNCSPAPLAPQLIPLMQGWVANDYPGTKTSIDEYNFGGTEAINGAVTQADILGIFGKYGLDKAQLWPTATYNTQIPGNMAFAIYRNYDGANSGFGDAALASTSGDQGKLSVYGARRTADAAVTVVVVNKTYGALTSTLSLPNFTPTTSAQVYLYSKANLMAIVAQPAQTVTPPPSGSNTSTLSGMTFPAQSITLLVLK